MKLNEMRIMKEPNYSLFRELIRDPSRIGDKFFSDFYSHAEELGVALNTFHIVYEGFWDLYCKKPFPHDLTAKKLEGWINRINVTVNSS